MATLHFHGHCTFSAETNDGTRILVDPFLSENPLADVGPEHFEDKLDYLLLTHGHGDHIGDTFRILKATNAMLISTYEVVAYAQEVQGHENAHKMHIGGAYDFPFGRVKVVVAVHGGKIDAPGAEGYAAQACGFLVTLDGKSVYFAGDTGLTKDMELLEGQVDVALLPIGDNFTMGPEDAGRAAHMIRPRIAVPTHYGTWPLIDLDPARFDAAVGDSAEVVRMDPGASLAL